MAADFMAIEVWVKIDEDGEYDVGRDRDEAQERYGENISEDFAGGVRLVKITLRVPLPKPTELTGEVAADLPAGELKVA